MKKKIILPTTMFLLWLSLASSAQSVTISATPNDTVCSLAIVNFTAVVSGCTGPYTYIWHLNSTIVQTSTFNQYMNNNLSDSDCVYCSVVAPSCGALTSNTICFAVYPSDPPTITSVSASPNPACAGQPVTLTATVRALGLGNNPQYQWYDISSGAIPGATNLSYTGIFSIGLHDIFFQVISSDTCASPSIVTAPSPVFYALQVDTCSSIGINETENNSTIKIYPNPTNGKINLQWENPSGVECKIFISDYIGKKISDFRTNENSLSIEDSALKSGIYFVTIKAGEIFSRSPVMIY